MRYVPPDIMGVHRSSQFFPMQFGYVILVFVYSWIMLAYLGIRVGVARKRYNIQYPIMYSENEPIFNCIQRAHQNTLEVYPQWLIFQLIAGTVYPVTASLFGLIWVTSRFSYAWGYYLGEPGKNPNGSYGYIGLLGVIGLSIMIALQMLGIC